MRPNVRNASKRLSRRTLLRGAGMALALPWLESIGATPVKAQTSGAPTRFVGLFFPNGYNKNTWVPSATGTDYALSSVLAPLENVKQKLLVLSGMFSADGTGHAEGVAGMLTGKRPSIDTVKLPENVLTIDQHIGALSADQVLFPQGIQARVLFSDHWAALRLVMSFSDPNTALPSEPDPAALFQRLFSGFQPAMSDPDAIAQAEKLKLYEGSVLDFVREDALGLQARLGTSDKARLDQYLTALREVEERIGKSSAPLDCGTPTAPGAAADPEAEVRNMMDVMLLGLRCDVARTATFQLGSGFSNYVYTFLGLNQQYHDGISHHGYDPTLLAALDTIKTWEMQQIAYLLEQMDAIDEGDGTFLDHSLFYASSDVSDPDRHNMFDMPILLAGSASGKFKTGMHLDVGRNPNEKGYMQESDYDVLNLNAAIAQAFGVAPDALGAAAAAPMTELLV
jgi:hypothetical protein